MELVGDEANRRIVLRVERINAGVADRSRVTRHVQVASQTIGDILRSNGWSIQANRGSNDVMVVEASINVEQLSQNIGKASECIDRVYDELPWM
jgi:hypothetical protein